MCLAVPGKIVTILVEEQARIGDYVMVHVGFALSIVDEEEARRVFDALRELDLLEDLETQEAGQTL
jgi:hydrogenase expression/formation protein HypC